MEFRLLGPVGVSQDGRQPWIGGRRERTLLALLLLAGGRVVPVHRMVDALWADAPPATARRQVQTGISTLRQVLGDRLATAEPGYRLQIGGGELDLDVFDARVVQARQEAAAGRPAAAADGLRAALELWRGPALGGVTGLTDEATGLEERRLAVLTQRVDFDLAAGRHVDLVAELPALIAEHPFTERFRAQLMLALYRAGRQAEALQVYRDARRTLAEDLGLEPAGELGRLERAILVADPGLNLPLTSGAATPPSAAVPAAALSRAAVPAAALSRAAPPRAAVPRAGVPAPCLLPADIADFTGRSAQVDTLCAALTGGPATSPVASAVVVSAVAGHGGVGKTALAVHVAHRLRTVFPDGQLYVDLHGADATPAAPADVLTRFLRTMGVDGTAIPDGLDERAELYRERLAGRRVLVLLDNARDEAQVLPLLPGSPTCGVLVTSRTRLGALPGARLVELDVLEPEQAVGLLGKIVGTRLADELDAAVELVKLCGHLPLAVRIAGAKLAARPHWRLADLVRRLADERQRLDELSHGGLAVRASIGLSYRGLDPDARRLFRCLGLLPVPEFAHWACAAVLDTSCAVAGDVAERLVDARLLQAVGPRRYRFHDLVRVYARERAHADDGPDERAAAQRRALGAWLALVERAHRAVYGGDYLIVHGAAPRWLPDEPVLGDPLGWFETERSALVAAVRQAAGLGLDEYAWDLAHSCAALFATRWYLDDWRTTHHHAMAAVRRAGNRRGEAAVLQGFGGWHHAHGRYEHALRCLLRSAELYEAVSDRKGWGVVSAHVSHVARLLGRFPLALASAERGRALTAETGDRAGEASALRGIAQVHLALGDVDRAERPLREALTILTAIGNRRDQAQVLHEIGELHLRRGSLDLAEVAFGRVLAIVRELGDRIGESFALRGIGRCLVAQGNLELAEARLTEALGLSRETGIRSIEGGVLMELGGLATSQGRPAHAVSRLRGAAELWQTLKMPLWQARALHRLGAVLSETGDERAAEAAWRAALDLFRELGTAEAEQVAERLATPRADAPSRRP